MTTTTTTKYGFYWHPAHVQEFNPAEYEGRDNDVDYDRSEWVELVTVNPETGEMIDVADESDIITHDPHGKPVADPRRYTEDFLLGRISREDVLFSEDF